MVEELAAISPPTIRPTKPTGRNFSIAGIRDVVAEQARIEVRECRLDVGELRVDEDRAERRRGSRARAAARSARR